MMRSGGQPSALLVRIMPAQRSLFTGRIPLTATGRTLARTAASLRRGGREAIASGLDLLFPPTCFCCDAPNLPQAEPGEAELGPERINLCETCRAALCHAGACCQRCGLEVGPHVDPVAGCARCRGERYAFERVVHLGRYDGELRRCVLRMKNGAESPLAAAVARWLLHECGDQLRALKADVVVPIPMHWSRRAWRGSNSADTLAEEIARGLSLPCAPWLVRRRRRTRPQTELSPTRRRQNMRGAFSVRRHRDLAGARVLVVDDVMTTGSTCSACARTLKRGGASWVGSAVVARAEP